MYPALTVLEAIEPAMVEQVLWVGGEGGIESTLVPRAGIPYQTVPAAGVHGVGLRTLPGNLIKLLRGFFAARKIIRQFQPQVMFFTGGYVMIPVALAGFNVTKLLFVPDIEPGLALKTMARLANRIAVTVEDASTYFSNGSKLAVTGYPTRRSLEDWPRARAMEHFQLDDEQPVLLVFGGSKGARSINRALVANLPSLLENFQVIHISGSLDWQEIETARQGLPQTIQNRYRLFEYLHEDMGAAYSAADLVLSRAGASTLGEYPLFGLPAILVPYPYAWRYQKINADYLVKKGAAILLPDEDLADGLAPLVQNILQDNLKRESMADAMRSLHKPYASGRIANLLVELSAKERKRE